MLAHGTWVLQAGLVSGVCCFVYVIIWVLCISYLHVTHAWHVITRLVGHLLTPKCASFDTLTLDTWHMDAAGQA